MTLPFLVIATSEVPAPMSTSTRFKCRIVGGISTLIAAIGSSVKACISSDELFSADCIESITCRGKNVAITVEDAFLPRCPTKVLRRTPSSSNCIVEKPTQ